MDHDHEVASIGGRQHKKIGNATRRAVPIALRDLKPGALVFEATVTKAVVLSGGRNIVDLDCGARVGREVRG